MLDAVMPPDRDAWRSRLWMGRTVAASVGGGFHDGHFGMGLQCRVNPAAVQFCDQDFQDIALKRESDTTTGGHAGAQMSGTPR
jgi:hypothetical protein